MSAISAAAVKSLRDRTNAPMMDCKAALTEANGDMEKAVDLLRSKNKSIQEKRGDKETAEGRVAVFIDHAKKVGAIIEVRCESAPVAKSEQFIKLADDLAHQVAAKNPTDVPALLNQPSFDVPTKTVNEKIGEVVGIIRENMKPYRFTRLEGQLGSYIHHDGTVGVLLLVEGPDADQALLREVCMHITACNPIAATRDEIPADRIAREKEIAEEQTKSDPKNANKPANIVEKIVEGRIKTWLAENVLLDQPFVKDPSKTVGGLLAEKKLKLVKFVRCQVGQIA